MKVPLEGGTPVTIAASGSASSKVFSVAVDSAYVYWTDSGLYTVVKAPLGGGQPTTIASGQSTLGHLALGPTSVNWVNQGFAANNGAVDSAPK